MELGAAVPGCGPEADLAVPRHLGARHRLPADQLAGQLDLDLHVPAELPPARVVQEQAGVAVGQGLEAAHRREQRGHHPQPAPVAVQVLRLGEDGHRGPRAVPAPTERLDPGPVRAREHHRPGGGGGEPERPSAPQPVQREEAAGGDRGEAVDLARRLRHDLVGGAHHQRGRRHASRGGGHSVLPTDGVCPPADPRGSRPVIVRRERSTPPGCSRRPIAIAASGRLGRGGGARRRRPKIEVAVARGVLPTPAAQGTVESGTTVSSARPDATPMTFTSSVTRTGLPSSEAPNVSKPNSGGM